MTDRMDIQDVLSQMRSLKTQIQQGVQASRPVPEGQQDDIQKTGFGDVLKSAVDKVNEQQMAAGKLSKAYESGDPTVDLPQVMIGLQKASVSFEAMTQVRNRLVSAYEDISKMPI